MVWGNPLCDLFPTLHAMADSKTAKVGEVWESLRGEGGWNLRFIIPFNDWEMEETQRLISLISSKKIAQRERYNLLDSRQERPIHS